MRMSQGVEWAVHACSLLAPLGRGSGLSLAALAEYHGVPQAYMAKQMQALSRAGIVTTSRGKTGGYALARPPAGISLWDIVAAIDGPTPLFRCSEVRQRGPCAVPRADCHKPCGIAAAFASAELAWRQALAETSLAMVVSHAAAELSPGHLVQAAQWIGANARSLPGG